MTLDEALAWLRGERSLTNIVPQHPHETWLVRIAEADAAATQQAYWIARAHAEGLLKDGAGEVAIAESPSWAAWNAAFPHIDVAHAPGEE